MDTRAKTIKEWIDDVRRGVVRLPRFQRDEVWTPRLVENFLWAILKDRPLGVFLVLDVATNQQPFKTRPLKGGPDNSGECREHLLDGQQRLTALWRSFNDNYDQHTFYVTLEETADGLKESRVLAVSKRGQDRGKIGNPALEFSKRWVPLKILAPGEEGSKLAMRWRKQVKDDEESVELLIERLRTKFNTAILPYLSLPQETLPDEAIDIFVETNRSSVNLSPYDIAVAQMESEVSESLQEKVDDLIRGVPEIEALDSQVGDLILKVQCLLENKRPTYGNYEDLNFTQLTKDWGQISEGVKWTTELLGDLRIWNEQQLPTAVPLRVLPALHRHIPRSGAGRAKALRLIRKYLWSAFLTDRYERQANDRLKVDHDTLVSVLNENKKESDVLTLQCKPPTVEAIKEAGWPKTRGILSRAILVACSLGGARDIASNEESKQASEVDYHHIFPTAALRPTQANDNLALNCMLLDPPTNREWSKKWPGDFLLLTIRNAGFEGDEAEEEVKKRLATHLLPADQLLAVQEGSGTNLALAYASFLNCRAKMVKARIEHLLKKGELN